MTFEDKVNFLRKHPTFKVTRISEIRAIAFALKEVKKSPMDGKFFPVNSSTFLALTPEDVEKVLRAYPDLELKLK